MNGYWNSLRPMEKRLVVGVGTMVVILLNLWFVVPHFSDLPKVQERKAKAQRTLETFQKEIDQKPKYVRWVAELQGEGQNVALEDQIYQFQNAIQSEVVRTGVQIQNQVKPHSQTNQFFIDQIQSVNLQAKEQQLVDFLFGLGKGPSIRVRDLTLHADPSHTMLQAAIKLVASYQKKPTAKGASASPAAQPSSPKSPPVEKKTALRVNPPTPAATNQAPATKPGAPPAKSPGPTDKKSTPNIKKP
jgi:hypothetical protein